MLIKGLISLHFIILFSAGDFSHYVLFLILQYTVLLPETFPGIEMSSCVKFVLFFLLIVHLWTDTVYFITVFRLIVKSSPCNYISGITHATNLYTCSESVLLTCGKRNEYSFGSLRQPKYISMSLYSCFGIKM